MKAGILFYANSTFSGFSLTNMGPYKPPNNSAADYNGQKAHTVYS